MSDDGDPGDCEPDRGHLPRIAVTGTPGTGKTTATERLERRGVDGLDTDVPTVGSSTNALDVIHLNAHVEAEHLYTGTDEARESHVVDIDAVAEWLAEREAETDGPLVIESHLAHHLAADRVVVLRCCPAELESRLRDRSVASEKATENAKSEALDLVLSAALERHGSESVYEIDTTDRDPTDVAREITAVAAGERVPSAGTVSFIEFFE